MTKTLINEKSTKTIILDAYQLLLKKVEKNRAPSTKKSNQKQVLITAKNTKAIILDSYNLLLKEEAQLAKKQTSTKAEESQAPAKKQDAVKEEHKKTSPSHFSKLSLEEVIGELVDLKLELSDLKKELIDLKVQSSKNLEALQRALTNDNKEHRPERPSPDKWKRDRDDNRQRDFGSNRREFSGNHREFGGNRRDSGDNNRQSFFNKRDDRRSSPPRRDDRRDDRRGDSRGFDNDILSLNKDRKKSPRDRREGGRGGAFVERKHAYRKR